ncbi:SDR family oxidoreductase [Nonomuraea recticatena]|uniref:SDR family oxidoreductase n=1 Tax=Nonomuraea recticatena TaxID=46178 RepID=UPI00360A7405
MILVTGATGRVGGQVVRQLVEAGVTEVRALARDASRARLPVEAVEGDLAVPGSLDAALEGVDKVFLVWPTLQADHAAPETVKRLAGRHVVYFSAATAGRPIRSTPPTGRSSGWSASRAPTGPSCGSPGWRPTTSSGRKASNATAWCASRSPGGPGPTSTRPTWRRRACAC